MSRFQRELPPALPFSWSASRVVISSANLNFKIISVWALPGELEAHRTKELLSLAPESASAPRLKVAKQK
jgi:hypothetical protein